MKTLFVSVCFAIFFALSAHAAQMVVGIEGMSCQSCVKKLTKHMLKKEGITSAVVNLEAKSLTLETSSTQEEEALKSLVKSWVEELGYTTTTMVLEKEIKK